MLEGRRKGSVDISKFREHGARPGSDEKAPERGRGDVCLLFPLPSLGTADRAKGWQTLEGLVLQMLPLPLSIPRAAMKLIKP